MIEIKELLGKFHKILSQEGYKKQIILSTLEDILKIKIKQEDLVIKNQNIFLNIKPIYKNEIFLHKEEITSKIDHLLGKSKIDKFY